MKLLSFQTFLFLVISINIHAQRGRVQIQDGTLVTDNGTLLRGAYHSTDVSETPPSRVYIDALKGFGLNTLHVYGECPEFNTVGEKVAMIDSLVEWTREDSLYMILTIGGGFTMNGQFDSAFVMDFWNIYAPRYKDETHLIYEICNEPYSWYSPYDSATLAMERWAYDTIRALAPETHILFMSYANARNADSVMNDINRLGMGIDWDNASIACHGYGVASENLRDFLLTIKNLGYAITNTEPASIENAYVNLATTRVFEEEFVSYTHFVSAESMFTDASVFTDPIESSEIRWTPDFGDWPASLTGIYYRNPYQEFKAGFYDEGRGFDLLNLDNRIGYINNDDYVAYYNFDFEDGPDSVIFKASSDNSSTGSINLILDSLNGQVIGNYPIGYTGDWNNYIRFSFPVSTDIEGVHKFYFLFQASHEYDIMNLESIRFKQNEVTSVKESSYSADGIIKLYPNPAKDYFSVRSAERAHLEIYSMQGRLLQTVHIEEGESQVTVDDLKPGNYLIKIVGQNSIYTELISIQ
jgi:hypothetical protein